MRMKEEEWPFKTKCPPVAPQFNHKKKDWKPYNSSICIEYLILVMKYSGKPSGSVFIKEESLSNSVFMSDKNKLLGKE